MVVFIGKVNITYGSSLCHGYAVLSVKLDVKMSMRLKAALEIKMVPS